jgi:hypothetical protein
MPESLDPTLPARLEALAARVRSASRAAGVVRLDDVWTGTEEEFLQLLRADGVSGFDDIEVIRDAGRTYVYSSRRMTSQYALLAARAECEDLRHTIVETVRSDSVVYPRPTSVTFFYGAPCFFSPEAVAAAIDALSSDPQYADILQLNASDGSLYLYSADHLHPAYAQSLAEWDAVERYQSF